MGLTAETITGAAGIGVALTEMLLKDVTPEMFARQPVKDGELIQTNHPAFILGHLCLYPAKIRELAGQDAGDCAMPAAFGDLFSAGVECRDDTEGSIYPAMDDIVPRFQAGHVKAFEFVGSLSEDDLAAPHHGPDKYKQMFPTLGVMTNFMLTSHVMMHLGQFSAWRRCMGLGPVM